MDREYSCRIDTSPNRSEGRNPARSSSAETFWDTFGKVFVGDGHDITFLSDVYVTCLKFSTDVLRLAAARYSECSLPRVQMR